MQYRKYGETPEEFVERIYEEMLKAAEEESKASGNWYDINTGSSTSGWFLDWPVSGKFKMLI